MDGIAGETGAGSGGDGVPKYHFTAMIVAHKAIPFAKSAIRDGLEGFMGCLI